MADYKRLERLHLQRTLELAESAGDEEWARQMRGELRRHKGPERVAKKAAPVKKADAVKKEGDD